MEEEASDSTPVDFWSFVEHAHNRLTTEFGSTHGLATELLLTLNRAANIITYDLEASVHRPRGLSWSAFRLLFVTWLTEPIEPMNAARLTGMSRAAVSSLSKPLVRDELLQRTPDPVDGRSIQLSLTPAGRELITTVYREHNDREQTWADGLTEAEQRILVMLLGKLIADRPQFAVRGRN